MQAACSGCFGRPAGSGSGACAVGAALAGQLTGARTSAS